MAALKKVPAVSPVRDLAKDMAAADILKAQLRDMYGEDVDTVLLRDMIEGETGLFETIDAVLQQIGVDAANIDGLKSFKQRLDERKSRLENRVEGLRALLLNALDILGEKKFERPIATMTAKPVAPTLSITDESAIPATYWKPQDPVLDKKLLTDALKESRTTLQQKLDELNERRSTMSDSDFEDAKERLLAAFPTIPGAELGNGSVTLQIRFS